MKVLHEYDASILPQYHVAAHLYEGRAGGEPYDHEALFGAVRAVLHHGRQRARAAMARRLYDLDPRNRSVLVKLAALTSFGTRGDSALTTCSRASYSDRSHRWATFAADEQGRDCRGLVTNIRKKPTILQAASSCEPAGRSRSEQSVDVPGLQPGTNSSSRSRLRGRESWAVEVQGHKGELTPGGMADTFRPTRA